MNKFEAQIAQAAKQLRDRENEKLSTPQHFFRKPSPQKYWIRMAVACCIGFCMGHFFNRAQPSAENHIAQALDTIFQTNTIYDTIYLPSEKAIADLPPAKSPKKTIKKSAVQQQATKHHLLAGKNILRDSIDFTLLASL